MEPRLAWPPARVTLGLAVYLLALAAQRAHELTLSRRHEARLAAVGATRVADPDYPWIVAFHVAWPLALGAEVALGARPSRLWPIALAALVAAALLRTAAMRALGDRWTARLWTLPGAPRIRSGPYRWLAHPSYVAVVIEVAAAPLLFGAWRTALAATWIDAVLLWRRVRREAPLLAEAPPYP
jgi:methyltransferase